ncbi:MAG: DUF262 domain-containing protein [Defluviitaleaceae bacterium]|nr:DUF262 domain-containing protein [Defluviitaleaceae bacterium]
MITTAYTHELQKLEEIAASQKGKIDITTVLSYIADQENQLPNVLFELGKKGVEVTYSDIEPDASENYEERIEPYDPSQINIRMDKITMDSIVKRLKNKEFELDSAFQRKGGLWNPVQKSQLIESLLLKIPLPAFYFDANDDDRWLIIDGLQRITTIKHFLVDKTMKLEGLEFFGELTNYRFDDLPRPLQRRIEETNINVYILDPGTPPNAKFSIFKRINTGGLVLTSQEIRNALFQGEATKFINKLAELKIFKLATGESIPSDRMLDREFCLRYVAINYLSINKDYKGVVDDFLNLAMANLKKMPEQMRESIKASFERVLADCADIFGRHAFRKMSEDGKRRPINKGLFEAWTFCILRLSPDEVTYLKKNKEKVIAGFIDLCSQIELNNALRDSHSAALNMRIKLIDNLLKSIINERAQL